MRLISARSRRAPAPKEAVKRAPAILAPRSKSRMPSGGAEVPVRPWARSRTRAACRRRARAVGGLVLAAGTLACGRLGSAELERSTAPSIAARRPSSSSMRALSSPTAAISAEASPPCCLTRPMARLASLRWRLSSSTSTRAVRRSASSCSQESKASRFVFRCAKTAADLLGIVSHEVSGKHRGSLSRRRRIRMPTVPPLWPRWRSGTGRPGRLFQRHRGDGGATMAGPAAYNLQRVGSKKGDNIRSRGAGSSFSRLRAAR